MTSNVLVVLGKYGLLSLLWVFIVVAVRAVRRDLTQASRPVERSLPGVAQPVVAAPPVKLPRRPGQARRLLVTQGDQRGTSVILSDQPVTLGRAPDCGLVLTDDYASNHHARLVPTDGGWLVEDLGSTNGTYLGSAKLGRPTALPLGQPISIGKTTLELRR